MDKTIFELSEKLKHPSDIDNRMEAIMNQCREDNEKQESRINALYVSELDGLKSISRRIQSIRESVDRLRSLKMEEVKIIQGSGCVLQNYSTVRTIVQAHENFGLARKFVESLQSAEDPVERDDLEKYHEAVYNKEEFMYELQYYNYGLSKDDFRVVEQKINQLKKVGYEFVAFVLKVVDDFVDFRKAFGAINRIVRIEEQRDLLTTKAKEGEGSEDPVAKQYYLQYIKYVQRDIKDLKRKIISTIKASIRAKFEALKGDEDFIARLDFIFEDLGHLRDSSLEFFGFNDFVAHYHKCLKELLDLKIHEMVPEDVLGIVEFKTNYYERMETEFDKISEALGDRLIEDESALLEKYSAAASSRLRSWIENITHGEIERFKSRDQDINRDEMGKLVSPGFINLMNIIKVRLEPVSFNKKIFVFLTNVIRERCQSFGDAITNSIQHEFKLTVSGKGLPGFEDYCIMFGNSGLKLTQYINSFDFSQMEEGRDLQNIFLGILKSSNSFLCDFIIHTCNPVVSHFFTPKWMEDSFLQVLVVTLDDFLQDYRKTMCDYSFMTFICTLCNKLYACYKDRLGSPDIVLDKRTARILRRDYERISKLLCRYTKEEDFVDYLKPMLKFVPLIETISSELFVVELRSLILTDSHVERSLVENVIEKRTDLDGLEKELILSKLDDVFSQESRRKKTFFSRILNK